MTQARTIYRTRRRSGSALPAAIRAWFAGERRSTFYRSTWPHALLLWDYWRAYADEHPGARPPQGFERLEAPPPERLHGLPFAELVAEARRGR